MTWNWYEWDSVEQFNDWHNAIKVTLGIPKLSIDSEGNFCEPQITQYTSAVTSSEKVIAMVELDYCQDLIATDLRPVVIEITEDFNK